MKYMTADILEPQTRRVAIPPQTETDKIRLQFSKDGLIKYRIGNRRIADRRKMGIL